MGGEKKDVEGERGSVDRDDGKKEGERDAADRGWASRVTSRGASRAVQRITKVVFRSTVGGGGAGTPLVRHLAALYAVEKQQLVCT